MFNKQKNIICITGADGSGKSTLIENLLQELPNAIEVTIWDALFYSEVKLFSNKKDIDNYLCSLTPNARLLFLAHAIQYAIDKALNADAETILLNAYYYKYFASENVLGADPKLIQALEINLPEPEMTIFLSITPEESANRKKRLSQYECGCKEATADNFIEFQKKASAALQAYIKPDWHILNAEDSPEILKEKALNFIQK